MEIRTPRLILRPLGTEYLASAHRYASDKENTKYMALLPNERLEETRRFLLSCEEEWKKEHPAYYEFAVLLNGTHIGAVCLYLDDAHETAELGWILDPAYHGNGYATEASRALVDLGRQRLGIRRCVAHCDAKNKASEAVMKKLGMRLVSRWGGRKNKGSEEERTECMYELLL